MVSVHGYNSEKKDNSFGNVYLMGCLFGVLAAVIFIGGGIGLKFLIRFVIEYWVWVIVLMAVVVFGVKIFSRRPRA